MSMIQKRMQYEFISQSEVNEKLDIIAEHFGMSREEMRVTKVRDEYILKLVEFISQNLFRASIEQLENQINKLLVYLKNDEFLVVAADVFEVNLRKLREDLGVNVAMTMSFSGVMGCKNGKKEVTIDEFSENAIRSYAKYIFDVNSEIVDIYGLLSENSPKDFNPHHHVRRRKMKANEVVS